jgi:hypothetical protein
MRVREGTFTNCRVLFGTWQFEEKGATRSGRPFADLTPGKALGA